MVKIRIIGITGAFGSGKTTAADFFSEKGYKKITLSRFLEDALIYSGDKKITRKKLQDLGNSWREMHGAGVLGVKARELIKEKNFDKVVIEGFRNISEVEEVRKAGNFKLIAVLANRDVRLKRLVKLKKREKLTEELFEKLDYRDMGLGENLNGLQTAICITSADVFLENNKTKDDFLKKLETLM